MIPFWRPFLVYGDQLLDHIDFHGMTAEELAGENGLLKKLTSRFYSKVLDAIR